MSVRLLVLSLAFGCGRIGFHPGSSDASGLDAAGPDAPPITDLVDVTSANGTNWIRSMVAAPDGYLITGASEGTLVFDGIPVANRGAADAFVLALDVQGRRRWVATCASGSEDLGYAVAADLEGNVYIGGTSGGALDCGGGPLPSASYMAWLASFTRDGVLRWARSFPSADPLPGNEIDGVRGLAVVGGRLVATGFVHGTVDLGGGPLAPIGGPYDGFVAAYGLDGAFVAARRFGNAVGRGLAVDGGGQVYIVGRVDGTVDFGDGPQTGTTSGFVASFTSDLQPRWSRLFGDAGQTEPTSIAYEPPSTVHVGGQFDGQLTSGTTISSAGSSDMFVASLGLDGTPRRLVRIGGPGCERAHALAVSAGELALVGRFTSGLPFQGTTLTSMGSMDGVLVTIGSDGVPRPTWSQGGALDDVFTAVAPTPGGVLLGGTLAQPVGTGCDGGFIFDVRNMLLAQIPH